MAAHKSFCNLHKNLFSLLIIISAVFYGDSDIKMVILFYVFLLKKCAHCQHFSYLISQFHIRFNILVLKCQNVYIYIYCAKYFRTVEHTQLDFFFFKKKQQQVFLKSTMFFSLPNNDILTKVITFSKIVAKKVMLSWTLFLILLTSAVT